MKKAVTSTTKTVLIYDQCEANVTFAVLDGDYRHLNGVYINMVVPEDEDEAGHNKKQDELNELVYNQKDGSYKIEMLDTFPTEAVREGAEVIVAGFLP